MQARKRGLARAQPGWHTDLGLQPPDYETIRFHCSSPLYNLLFWQPRLRCTPFSRWVLVHPASVVSVRQSRKHHLLSFTLKAEYP